jgi:site-specific recombinase XerD
MKLTLVHQPAVPASASPYRLLDEEQRQEIAWMNAFLDAQRIRQLSLRSLRAYAYDLLHFARWWLQQPPLPLSQITESTLLDYVRHQLDQQPKPTPQTVNHRLCVVRCLFRFHCGHEIPAGESHFQHLYTKRFSLRYGRPLRVMALGIRLRQPRRMIVPLSSEQVTQFWDSFRTFRDLALVGLMLLDGLRSCEVLTLELESLQLAERHIRILGKECHSYCISFRRRNETTIIHACRQASDLAFSLADVLLAVHTGIGLGPCTDAHGVGRVGPMCELFPA